MSDCFGVVIAGVVVALAVAVAIVLLLELAAAAVAFEALVAAAAAARNTSIVVAAAETAVGAVLANPVTTTVIATEAAVLAASIAANVPVPSPTGVVAAEARALTAAERIVAAEMKSAAAAGRPTYTGVGSAADNIYDSTRPLAGEFPELVNVNPHYVKNAGPGVNTNCVSCVNATQQRLLGQNPSAVASPSNGYGNANDLLPSAPFGFGPATTPAAIQAELLAAGNSAVGVVRISQGGTIEHVINVTNRSGQVYFIDSQSGHIVDLNLSVKVFLGTP